jgi:hypothetical protein
MAEKKLPDITRRQFLKGAAKVAGATALPGSGLASIGEAVKMGLDINQKLDLTKNILQGLAQNELTSRENRIFALLKSFTTDGGRLGPIAIYEKKGIGPLDRIKDPEYYKEKLFKTITENPLPPIIGSDGEFVEGKDLLKNPTMEEINTVLEKKSNQSKLFNAVTEYNLPLNAVRKQSVKGVYYDEISGELQDGGFLSYKDALKNFSNIKNKFLQEYKDESSPIVEYFKKSEMLNDIGNKIKKKYNLNNTELQDILPSFEEDVLDDVMGTEEQAQETLNRLTGLNLQDLQDPLFAEYDNLKEDMDEYQVQNLYASGDRYDHTYHNSFQQQETNEALNIGKDILDFALDQGQKYVGKKLYEKLRPGEQQPPPTKRLPEPEAIEVEVQDKKEIPVQTEQEAPVPPGSIKSLITKGVKRSPLIYLLSPTKMGDAELKIPRRKGGTVIRNYNNNYNTQRTI